MLKSVLTALPLGLLALAAEAGPADFRQRDPACKHIATVQYLDCQIAVLYSCPGPNTLSIPLIREESYTSDGYDSFEVDTANGGMVATGDASGSYQIHTDIGSLQETTMAEVMQSGAGSFVAKGTITMFGVDKPAGQRIAIKATGDTALFSGLEAKVYIAEVAVDLPEPIGATISTSKAYLVPSLGIYLAGEESAGTFFKSDDTPHRPMSIAVPGQPGFDTTKPGFCGGSLSLVLPLPALSTSLNGVPT